jgi:hypothetical protein
MKTLHHYRAYYAALASAQRRIQGMSIREMLNLQQHMREWGTGTLKSCSHERIATLQVVSEELKRQGVVSEDEINKLKGNL